MMKGEQANTTEFDKACNQAKGALYNFQAWLEKEHQLTGIEAAKVATEILDSLPKVFTPRGLKAYIDSVKEESESTRP